MELYHYGIKGQKWGVINVDLDKIKDTLRDAKGTPSDGYLPNGKPEKINGKYTKDYYNRLNMLIDIDEKQKNQKIVDEKRKLIADYNQKSEIWRSMPQGLERNEYYKKEIDPIFRKTVSAIRWLKKYGYSLTEEPKKIKRSAEEAKNLKELDRISRESDLLPLMDVHRNLIPENVAIHLYKYAGIRQATEPISDSEIKKNADILKEKYGVQLANLYIFVASENNRIKFGVESKVPFLETEHNSTGMGGVNVKRIIELEEEKKRKEEKIKQSIPASAWETRMKETHKNTDENEQNGKESVKPNGIPTSAQAAKKKTEYEEKMKANIPASVWNQRINSIK